MGLIHICEFGIYSVLEMYLALSEGLVSKQAHLEGLLLKGHEHYLTKKCKKIFPITYTTLLDISLQI